MNRRIKEKHEKQCSTGKHGMRREWKELLKSLGVWSFCQSQQEIMRKGHRKTSCKSCIKDCTDACLKGAGRAVDDSICEEYLEEQE